jgi:hypothetical protein
MTHPMKLRLLAALLLSAPLAACDPCAGLSACGTSPHLNYPGRVIDRDTGKPVAGVRVSFIRIDGVAISPDTVVGISDSDGHFLLRADAAGEGQVRGDYLVEPPGLPGYRVAWQSLVTVNRAGEGRDLGTLVTVPYHVFVGAVRRADGSSLVGARLDYRQTGGVVASPADTTVTVGADGAFFIAFRAGEYGPIEGMFTLRGAGGAPLDSVAVTVWTSHTVHLPYATPLVFR